MGYFLLGIFFGGTIGFMLAAILATSKKEMIQDDK
jgi:gas vesicle protein